MSLSGLKLAVKYSLPPCRLGFCGPRDEPKKRVLYEFVSGEDSLEDEVRQYLSQFEAMYPYLRLIASKNGIEDPFDERVVKALWVGDELLDAVGTDDVKELIRTEFVKPTLLSKGEAEKRIRDLPGGLVPHHSFHVFALGSITGRVDLDGAMRELCRISWGEVFEVGDGRLKVRFRPINQKNFSLGNEVEKEIDWDDNVIPGISRGDFVSFHWGKVCDVLGKKDVKNLQKYTQKTLSALSK